MGTLPGGHEYRRVVFTMGRSQSCTLTRDVPEEQLQQFVETKAGVTGRLHLAAVPGKRAGQTQPQSFRNERIEAWDDRPFPAQNHA